MEVPYLCDCHGVSAVEVPCFCDCCGGTVPPGTLISAPVSREMLFHQTTLLTNPLISLKALGLSKSGKKDVVQHCLGN